MSEKRSGNSGGVLTKTGMTVIALLCVCVIGMSYSIYKACRAVQSIEATSFDGDAWEMALAETENLSENQADDGRLIEEPPLSAPDTEYEPSEEDGYDFDESPDETGETDEASESGENAYYAEIDAVPVFGNGDTGLTMLMPLSGRIICDYSSEDLVYSETFDDWRVHLGIDIAADEGTPVRAAAAGIADKIYNDESLGLTVVIRHTSYISTMYCGLSECDLSEGDLVSQGDTVGLSGNTAAFESALEPHLHFAVLRGGTPADPYEYLVFDE